MIRKFEADSFRPRIEPTKRRVTLRSVLVIAGLLVSAWWLLISIGSSGLGFILDVQLSSPLMLLMSVLSLMVVYSLPVGTYARLVKLPSAAPQMVQAVGRVSGEQKFPEVSHVEITPAELHSILADTRSPTKRRPSDRLAELRTSGKSASPLKVPSRHDTPLTTPLSRPSLTAPTSATDYPEATTVWAGLLEGFVVSQWLLPLIDSVKKSDSQLTQAFS